MAVDWDVDEAPPPVLDLSAQELSERSLCQRLREAAAAWDDDECDGPRSLRLERNQLVGLPSSALALLGLQLHTLDVSHNLLFGLGESLPCPNLRVLVARGNHLTSLPKRMPSTLQVVNLSGNQFATLPDQLTQLPELRLLYMGGNRLSQLPDSVGRMQRYRSFEF